jgi:hypothetical protein
MPTPTDLVTDLPADFEVFGQAVDTQMKTNADAATQKATLTTKGDIYVATGTSTPARLAVGATDGHVLTVDSTTATGLKYAAAGGGAYTLLSSGSCGTGNSLAISSIPQTYRHLRIVFKDLAPATGAGGVQMRIRLNNTSTAIYDSTPSYTASNSSGFGNSSGYFAPFVWQGTTDALSVLDITNYAQTDTYKFISSFGMSQSSSSALYSIQTVFTSWTSTAAINRVDISPAFGGSDTINSGTYEVFGVN